MSSGRALASRGLGTCRGCLAYTPAPDIIHRAAVFFAKHT